MRGSIVKRMSRPRDGSAPKPRYYARIGGRWLTDPATGKAFTRKADAERFVTAQAAAVHAGTWVRPSSITVAEHARSWLTLARSRLKPSTWSSYRRQLSCYLLPHLGGVQLQQLTAGHLDDLYTRLLTAGRRDGMPLAARTVAYVHVLVKALLADAVRKGLLTGNPAAAATPPAARPAGGHATWTAGQLAGFLDHTGSQQHGTLWAFLALTGCRRGEALALRWSDIDQASRRVVLSRSITPVDGGTHTGTPKSGRGRTVALDPGLLARLDAHRKAQTAARMAAAAWHEQDLVFTGPDGRPLHPDTISRAFKRATAAAELPPIRLHDLRHTWATLALRAGINPKIVQERLGHSSVTITLGVYSHVLPSMHDEAATTIASLIDERRPGQVLSFGQIPARESVDGG